MSVCGAGCQCVVQGVSGWYLVSVCGAGCQCVVPGVCVWCNFTISGSQLDLVGRSDSRPGGNLGHPVDVCEPYRLCSQAREPSSWFFD